MMPDTEIIGPVPEVQRRSESAPHCSARSEQVREYIRASKAENTLRGYQSDWRDFCAWCEARGLGPLPASAETVATYIAECAGRLKVGSIQRRLNAIAEAHKAVGMESPTHQLDRHQHHEGHSPDAGDGAGPEGRNADG